MARITKAGGFVSPPPEPGLSARVWLDAEFTQVGLAMARSIGDHAVKVRRKREGGKLDYPIT